jgi:uncharacterized membrane protein HdeD (DUF308 family)
MLPTLSINWVFLLLRVIAAVLFGLSVLFWPMPPATTLVPLFAAYAAVDGAVALRLALSVKGVPGFGSLLFAAVVRIGVAPDLRWVPGAGALLFASTLLALVLPFRQLAEEIAMVS